MFASNSAERIACEKNSIANFALIRGKTYQISHICDGVMQCGLISPPREKNNTSTFFTPGIFRCADFSFRNNMLRKGVKIFLSYTESVETILHIDDKKQRSVKEKVDSKRIFP